jgi:MFS family permease
MRNIIILGLTSLLTDISSEMVYPLVPLFLVSLGSGPAILGLVEGIAESTASLLKVFSGYWSDRLGRRKLLAIVGYAGSTVGKGLLVLATNWTIVLTGRVADRMGKGIRTAPRDALIADSAEEGKRGKAFGLHRAMDTAGAVGGVAIAILILNISGADIRRVIVWSLVPALVGVALLFLVREVRLDTTSRTTSTSFQLSAIPSPLRRFLFVSLIFSLGNSSNTFLLLRASNEQVPVVGVLFLYLAYNIAYSIFSYPAGKLSDRLGRKSILVAGYTTYAAVYLGMAVLPPNSSYLSFLLLFCLYGLYSGLTDGVEKAFVVDLVGTPMRATAIGLHATIVGAGLLPASLIAGQLWSLLGPAAPFAFGGGMAFFSAFLLMILL